MLFLYLYSWTLTKIKGTSSYKKAYVKPLNLYIYDRCQLLFSTFECIIKVHRVREMPSQTPTTDSSGQHTPPMDPKPASTTTANEEIPQSAASDPTDQSKSTGAAVSNTSPMESRESDRPKFSSSVRAKERLKFILGASEDNSSDDETLVMGQTAKPQPESTETPHTLPTTSSEVVPPSNPSACLRWVSLERFYCWLCVLSCWHDIKCLKLCDERKRVIFL